MNPNSKYEPHVRPLRERHRAETVQAVIEAAESVFAARGLHEARVEEIASRAGVSVGTLYNHFEDRNAVLAALLETRRKELKDKLDRALVSLATLPFREQLRSFCRVVFEHFEQHREFMRIILDGEQDRSAKPSAAMREILRRVEALVQRGHEGRALRADKSSLWPALFMGSVRAVMIHDLLHPGALTLDQRVQAVAGFYLEGAGA